MKRTVTVIAVAALLLVLWHRVLVVQSVARASHDEGHLKQIGLACRLFAGDNNGRFPDDWAQLETYVEGSRTLFVTDDRRTEVGAMGDVMQWTDYVYVCGLTTNSATNAVLAYLLPEPKRRTKEVLVVYVDGQVGSLSVSEFTKVMNKSPKAAQVTPHKFGGPGH